jgi:hypothetical protein
MRIRLIYHLPLESGCLVLTLISPLPRQAHPETARINAATINPSKPAGWMLVPYLAWVSFAAFLNYTLWRMNPG